jgi:hypothetical protein
MTKMKHIFAIIVLALAFNACVKPKDPTPVQILTGEWKIESVIANGDLNLPDDVFMANSTLHLDRNNTFLFVNVNGRAMSGTWEATETALNLTIEGAAGAVMTMNIVYMNYEKLHAYYSFNNSATGAVEVRYLFNRVK